MAVAFRHLRLRHLGWNQGEAPAEPAVLESDLRG